MLVSGPFDLNILGNKIVIWAPIMIGKNKNKLWGVVGAVVDHLQIMEDAGIASLMSIYRVQIKSLDSQNNLDTIGNYQSTKQSNQQRLASIQLPFGDWQLVVEAKKTPWYLDSHYQNYGLLILGLALGAGLAMWTYIHSYRQRKRDYKTLEFHRRYDAITKLPNRSLLLSRLRTKILRAANNEIEPFALLYIDLDYFKQVNDMLGYPGGDQFLRKLSSRLKNALQPGDILARSGSDEFVMTVQNIHRRDQAERIAKDLLKELGEPLRLGGHAIASSCSIGIALYPRDGDEALTLLRHADRAMYQAKVIGRGTFSLVDKALRSQSSQELKKRMSLQQALQRKKFLVCYQPIIDLQSGKVSKCEALVTWQDGARTSLLGNDYIAVAEQGGLIRHLGLWVLDRVCKDMQHFRKEDINLQVTVNRSSQEFLMPDASIRWLDILDKYNVPHQDIVFEITESLLMDEKEKTLQQIRLLKDSGIDFAVDDFGTGYSAINYLRRFPVKYLKIDQSFICQMHNNKQDRVLVEIMIKLAEALHIKVIAEGVETESQYVALRNMGCHFIQGYYVAKPLRLEELIAFKKDEVNKRKWQTHASQR
ncbi:MAG TPA: bifunctional diguanylate cyclase/phosphodiesterase [Crenotrichaceae bacterium]|nr:bifunctional diguanylate cyclase/phosphodiesterase [Crenotrichaceae bacterium]